MKTPIATISHHDIKSFLQESLQKKGSYKTGYYIAIIISGFAFCGLCGYTLGKFIFDKQIGGLVQVIVGMVFSLTALVVIHELIHGVAYKMNGARRVYYGGNIRKFVFYAAAHLQVFNVRQFTRIALAPFITVSIMGIMLIFIFPDYTTFLLSVLSIHTFFCGGDFLFLHFMSQYDSKKLHTHDDRDKAETYFYYVE